MPETQTPPPAPTQEINIAQLGNKGKRTQLPSAMTEAINAAAAARGGTPAAEALPDGPPSDPTPPPRTPPVPNAAPSAPLEPPKPITPPTQTAPAPAEEPKGIKNLRENLERKSREYEEVKASLTATSKEKADAALREAEANVKLASALEREEKEYKPRMERLKKVEEDLARKEEILRIKDYTATDEFHEKYVKPIAEAQRDVTDFLSQIEVPLSDGSVRPASMKDFDMVLGAPSHTAAREIAKQLFGEDAPTILQMRLRLQSHIKSREEGMKNAGLASAEFVKQQQVSQIQQREQFVNTMLAEANRLVAQRLQIPEDDADLKSEMTTATEFADSLWSDMGNKSFDQQAKMAAQARANNIEAPVRRKQVEKLQARVAELETRLKDYESSEPEIKISGNGRTAAPVNGDKPERNALLAAAQAIASKRGG